MLQLYCSIISSRKSEKTRFKIFRKKNSKTLVKNSELKFYENFTAYLNGLRYSIKPIIIFGFVNKQKSGCQKIQADIKS